MYLDHHYTPATPGVRDLPSLTHLVQGHSSWQVIDIVTLAPLALRHPGYYHYMYPCCCGC